jgi:sugar phosphate isomerase/epimerase
MSITRREFAQVALAGTPVIGAALRGDLAAAAVGQTPSSTSRWAGVLVGLNVPYSFGMGNNMAAEDLLQRVIQVGVGSLELRAQPVEHFLGSPTVRAAVEAAKAREASRAAGAAAPTPQQMAAGSQTAERPKPTAEQVEKARREAADVRTWRLAAPTGKLKELRQTYEQAGVAIDILKVDGLYAMSAEEVDYFFQMARDLGARAISAELPENRSDTKRIGAFADTHKVFMAYHHHAQPNSAAIYEQLFTEARYNAANIDIGHWTATQGPTPLPFITKHADRIPHIHVKDRRLGTNGGENTPFGQGDTQIRPILQAIRDHKWNIRPIIEFEYKVPEGSDRVTEIKKCLAYCRDSLMA